MRINYPAGFPRLKKADSFTFWYDLENSTLQVRCYKGTESFDSDHIPIEIIGNLSRYKKIVIQIESVDYAFKLLKKDHRLSCYSHNLEGIKIKENDTSYYMDTIVIYDIKGKNRVRIDQISFNDYGMIRK